VPAPTAITPAGAPDAASVSKSVPPINFFHFSKQNSHTGQASAAPIITPTTSASPPQRRTQYTRKPNRNQRCRKIAELHRKLAEAYEEEAKGRMPASKPAPRIIETIEIDDTDVEMKNSYEDLTDA
jgi:hypothetical protein